jgi:hypothetical protein
MSDRVLGEFETYGQLHDILRLRASDLKISRLDLDEVSGLQPGMSAKLLSPRPLKRLGPTSMPLLAAALGIKFLVAVDDEKTAALQRRIAAGTIGTKRDGAMHTAATHFSLSHRFLRKIARKGGLVSRARLSPAEASARGRKAANARWDTKRKRSAHAYATIARAGR